MSEETKELTKTQSKELASVYADLGIESRAGEGQKNATQADYAMPFLSLLQSGSPQVKRTDSRFIQGAEEGMFFNTVEKELYPGSEGVAVIPVAYRRAFVEWKLRESGGGYVGEHPVGKEPETHIDDKNRDILENGNELKDTRYWYVLVVKDDAAPEPAVIGMTRTQIKPSRAWFNMCSKDMWPDGVSRGDAPPLYVWSYLLKAVPQQKDDNSFWNYDVRRAEPVTDPDVLRAAMKLHDSIEAGDIREATETLDDSEEEAADSAPSY